MTSSVNLQQFDLSPIVGYPTINWRGKRPFTSATYYPAQLRETYGQNIDAWRNRLYWGDNLQVMSHLLKEFRGGVQLIYLDPPFDSKADYRRRVSLRGQAVVSDRTAFEEKQYTDIWTNDEYLQYIYERLVLLRELLSSTGVIYLHADHRKEHHLRMLMDEVFGPDNFLNKISWRSQVARGAKVNAFYLPFSTHYIVVYAKRKSLETTTWHPQRKRTILSEAEAAQEYMLDEMGYFRTSDPGSYSFESLCQLHERGLLYAPYGGRVDVDSESRRVYASNGGNIAVKYYLESLGNGRYAVNRAIDNLWEDVPGLGTTPGEDVGYPTQKTKALLRRIILMSSNPGDLVLDAFMGSGTTQVTAMELGRKFIGVDINSGSVQTVVKRLLSAIHGLEQDSEKLVRHRLVDNDKAEIESSADRDLTLYTGFNVYNVNCYDVFPNPAEAKDVILAALETQRLAPGSVFDATRDGRLVKVMPINRIATPADLNELLANLDYKSMQRRYLENPSRVIEKITLVCMGHEPDLAACLKQELHPYNVDVEVLDILRDRSDIQFRRDSEARIKVCNEMLTVEAFYPMNLLQKLSQQKDSVEDWREIVESIMVDRHYDGAVFAPELVDVPDDDALVRGAYEIPRDAGSIRIKITDLLLEIWEGTVAYG